MQLFATINEISFIDPIKKKKGSRIIFWQDLWLNNTIKEFPKVLPCLYVSMNGGTFW